METTVTVNNKYDQEPEEIAAELEHTVKEFYDDEDDEDGSEGTYRRPVKVTITVELV